MTNDMLVFSYMVPAKHSDSDFLCLFLLIRIPNTLDFTAQRDAFKKEVMERIASHTRLVLILSLGVCKLMMILLNCQHKTSAVFVFIVLSVICCFGFAMSALGLPACGSLWVFWSCCSIGSGKKSFGAMV